MNEIQYISRNGGRVLLNDGYQYYKQKVYRNDSTFWICSQRKKIKCMGSITTSGGTITKKKEHTCPQDFNKNEVDIELDLCVKKCIESDEVPAPQIYQTTVGSLKDRGIDMLCKIPRFPNIKSRMYYNRNKQAEVSKIVCKNVLEVEVPKKYRSFLLEDYADEVEGIRIQIFCSKESRLLMETVTSYFSDGTFKSCPKPFAQLYVFHGDLGSTEDSTNIIPLAYALLSDKTRRTYETLFHLLQKRIPKWKPLKYKTDNEERAMQAVANAFSGVDQDGCYYHYNKCIWNKGKELKLTASKLTRRITAMCAVLALLPHTKVLEGWDYIKTEAIDLIKENHMSNFLKYFDDFWLRSEEFIKVWTVFGERHRTTNFLEGWNFKLNTNIGKKKVNITQLLHFLNRDAAFYTVCGKLIKEDKAPTKRDISEIKNDRYILKCQMQLLNSEISVGHFLHKVK